jgi:hypothetical protein
MEDTWCDYYGYSSTPMEGTWYEVSSFCHFRQQQHSHGGHVVQGKLITSLPATAAPSWKSGTIITPSAAPSWRAHGTRYAYSVTSGNNSPLMEGMWYEVSLLRHFWQQQRPHRRHNYSYNSALVEGTWYEEGLLLHFRQRQCPHGGHVV